MKNRTFELSKKIKNIYHIRKGPKTRDPNIGIKRSSPYKEPAIYNQTVPGIHFDVYPKDDKRYRISIGFYRTKKRQLWNTIGLL